MHVLLVAHGSRDPRHATTMTAVADAVRARGVTAEVAYLDHVAPSVLAAVRALAPDVDQPVVAVPMLLTTAFHAKVDMPAALAEAAAARPDLELRTADVLGPDPLLGAAMARRLREHGVALDAPTGILVVAAGSSDDAARAEVAELSRDWLAHFPAVHGAHAFASGPGPGVADAVRLLAVDAARITIAPYLLADGALADRAVADAREAGRELGVEVDAAEVIGAAPELVELVVARAAAS